jgi:hypothetical protein
MKTSELIGTALDWAVAKIESSRNLALDETSRLILLDQAGYGYNPSTDWSQGGPIIEREAIQITPDEYKGTWTAYMTNGGEPYECEGPTPLIAAMRCYVASKLGDTVELPTELLP